MKVIFPSLFLFFTWAPSTTLGGVFFFGFIWRLWRRNEGLGVFMEKSKSYFYVCMHGWNNKVLKFWSTSRSQGGIL